MSRVFVATDKTLDRSVVIKILHEDIGAEVNADRFRREIQFAARLQHPHIVPLLSAGQVRAMPYFTMPFIKGESLRAKLSRDGELPVNDAVRILRQVASALSYAHRNGVVHRDIKPDNVMLSDDFALVTDFGVARALTDSTKVESSTTLTTRGIALGTPAYMAPEQAAADPAVDHRADIYAFGVMAYEILAGQPPFAGRPAPALMAAHAIEKPESLERRRPGIPPALTQLVMRCLEKRPADRPQSAVELLSVLDSMSTSSATQSLRAREFNFRPWIVPSVAVAGFVLLIALGYFLTSSRNTAGSGESGTTLSSLAVLPLVNVGGDQKDEYFSDGMTDELATALNKLPGLRIASRTSTYAFKGRKDVDVGAIGERLKVQAVLEGTVRRSGDRLKVSAQLTNVSDGLTLWSESYERLASDVFAVQDEIARAIADALKLRLGNRASELSSTSRGTENLEAYDLFLRGRFFWNQRGEENLRRAISYFERALARDSNYARAHAAMGMAYALLPEYTDSPPPNADARAIAAARKALALDSTIAEAYTAIGLASNHAWKFAEAEEAYRKAINVEPGYATGHQWYGELLYTTGRVDSAIAEMRRAVDLDPLAPILPSALGYTLKTAGRLDEAIASFRQAIELAPNMALPRAMLGIAYAWKGESDAAVREAEMAVRLAPELTMRKGQLAYVYGLAGHREKAAAIVRELEQRQRSGAIRPMPLVLGYIGLGERAKALEWLEKALAAHDIGLLTASSLLVDRTFDPLRGDPRFERIIDRMGLGPYRKYAPKRQTTLAR